VKIFYKNLDGQKGATTILLSVLVLAAMLTIGLTISAVMISQIKMTAQAGQSVKAFYAADSGVELCLYQARNLSGACAGEGGSISNTLSNSANYSAQRIDGTTINSTGFFGKTSRRVQLTWEGGEVIETEPETDPEPEVLPPPVDQNTKLFLHADETAQSFFDSSYYNHPVFAVGDATQTSIQYVAGGKSAYLDGSGDYLTIPDSDDWDFGTGDFTIDYWEYRISASAADATMRRDNTDGYTPFMIGRAGAGIYMTSSGSSWDIASNKTLGSVSLNKWVHHAVVRSGNTFYAFKNGEQTDTWTSALGLMANANPITIGLGWNDGAQGYLNGYLDELRVSKGIALWTSNFTPPNADSYTKLLLHADGSGQTFTDASLFSHPISAVDNATQSVTQHAFAIGKSAYFDGSGDYLTIPDSDDWNFGTGDFTIDFWMYPLNYVSEATIFSQRSDSSHYNILMVKDSGNLTYIVANYYGIVDITFPKPSINNWHHIAVVRNGNNFSVFVDGTSVGTDTCTDAVPDLAATFQIAYRNVQNYFNGYIDEFRVSKGVARWISNFTPPTSSYRP
jgi:hypothetical protein